MVHKAPKQHTIASIRKGKPGTAELYKKEYDGIAERMVKKTAATVSEIAEVLGVSISTIYNWQSRHPSFQQALQVPEEMANHRVAMSLYNQSVGYQYEDEEIKIVNGELWRVKIKRWMPPNTSAAIFWAKAKMGWSDREVDALPPPPNPDEIGDKVDPITQEPLRQAARRVLLTIYKGGKVA